MSVLRLLPVSIGAALLYYAFFTYQSEVARARDRFVDVWAWAVDRKERAPAWNGRKSRAIARWIVTLVDALFGRSLLSVKGCWAAFMLGCASMTFAIVLGAGALLAYAMSMKEPPPQICQLLSRMEGEGLTTSNLLWLGAQGLGVGGSFVLASAIPKALHDLTRRRGVRRALLLLAGSYPAFAWLAVWIYVVGLLAVRAEGRRGAAFMLLVAPVLIAVPLNLLVTAVLRWIALRVLRAQNGRALPWVGAGVVSLLAVFAALQLIIKVLPDRGESALRLVHMSLFVATPTALTAVLFTACVVVPFGIALVLHQFVFIAVERQVLFLHNLTFNRFALASVGVLLISLAWPEVGDAVRRFVFAALGTRPMQ